MSFGDASKAVANGRDTILYLQKDGWVGQIWDVCNVLDLKSIMLSIKQLIEKDYSTLMKDQVLLYFKYKLEWLIPKLK